MACIYGKPVLNGKRIWVDNDPAVTRQGLKALNRLKAEGENIVFLTSTTRGLSIYPTDIAASCIWECQPVAFEEVIHHRLAYDYKTRHRNVLFKLFRYTAPANQ